MKKIFLLLSAAAMLLLTSCDTTREITIKDNGSGEMVTTLDMSGMVGVMKMAGQGKEMPDQKMDSIISLGALIDSIPDLSDEEKQLMRKGTMHMVMNMDEEQLFSKFTFPFNSISDINKINALSSKVQQEMMKKEIERSGEGQPMGGDMPNATFEDYFDRTFAPGLIEMKLNKEKYQSFSKDEGAQAIRQMADQGMPMNNKYIFRLPKPAKKVEGAGAVLSEDKKTVTVETELGDFFDNVSKMEFRIEY